MMRTMIAAAAAVGLMCGPRLASAQGRDPRQGAGQTDQIKESRYQIGQMERVLEGAVEHGAELIREKVQGLVPADMMLAENARARGFRLDGYGVFFDVDVPSLEGLFPWSFQSLTQNDLGIENALRTLRSFVEGAAAGDVNLQQAMKRIELQMSPVRASLVSSGAAVAPGQITAAAPPAAVDDAILKNPSDAYRAAISAALVDAMLEHSRGLGIGAAEWLTVAARSSDNQSRLAPVDTDSRTVVIRVRGADLTAFLGGQIDRDEARRRVEVRVF